MENKPFLVWMDLYEEMEASLIRASKLQRMPFPNSKQSVQICASALQKLKQRVSDYTFPTPGTEIQFFKEIKPKFYSQYIYYSEVYKIELRLPAAGKAAQELHFRTQLQQINVFCESYLNIYQYYRLGASYLDDVFFLRNAKLPPDLLPYSSFEIDPTFSTHMDNIFSRINANELLSQYLQQRINMLSIEANNSSTTPIKLNKKTLQWTDSKTALIELTYALHARKSFNNGKASLEQLFDLFEDYFQVDLGNTSRMFQDILSRKKGTYLYMDSLLKALDDRVTEMLGKK